MYRISELAALTGLSRTALLYYEKLGLITGQRLENGYRAYRDRDVQHIRLVQQLQKGGLTLLECKACLDSQLDYAVLQSRYTALQHEIAQKQQALTLLAGLLGKSTSKGWHETLAEIAPDAYFDWLRLQGYDEKQALRIKWLSKDMNEHEQYMQDFFRVFSTLESWGPGSVEDTTKAYQLLPSSPAHILEIGCGNGNATMTLAALSDADIIAIDNEQSALNRLEAKIQAHQRSDRVSTACVSMTELRFAKNRFDLIWSEGAIYVMGVESALAKWQPLLKPQGMLVFSDLVWLTDQPNDLASEFWRREYPDMQNIDTRLRQIQQAGYQVTGCFTVSENAWKNYYAPLQQRVSALKASMPDSQALSDIQYEINIYQQYLGEFGYQFFIAQKSE